MNILFKIALGSILGIVPLYGGSHENSGMISESTGAAMPRNGTGIKGVGPSGSSLAPGSSTYNGDVNNDEENYLNNSNLNSPDRFNNNSNKFNNPNNLNNSNPNNVNRLNSNKMNHPNRSNIENTNIHQDNTNTPYTPANPSKDNY